MYIEYKYNYMKALVFIDKKGGGITDIYGLYFACFINDYYNVSILPFVCAYILGRHLNVCNSIYLHNKMW